MAYALTRTSMALDQNTLKAIDYLAKKWEVSKAEVMRRAVKHVKEDTDLKEQQPKPLEALEWLQKGGGLSVQEGERLREGVRAERQAKRYWWEH